MYFIRSCCSAEVTHWVPGRHRELTGKGGMCKSVGNLLVAGIANFP